jgi:hypothetical protein
MRIITGLTIGLIAKARITYLLPAVVLTTLFTLPQAMAQSTIFEESFDDGLNGFHGSTRVYTGSYGVRLRGGGFDSGQVLISPAIQFMGYEDVSFSYYRSTYGLDDGEFFKVEYSLNGAPFMEVESRRSATGRTSHQVDRVWPNLKNTLTVRFTLFTSSFFESLTVDDFVVEGMPVNGGGDGDNDGSRT